mmetsp:Transcript_92926/g.200946  ORF Transcript_92926/g.200946 Transcript_92926/m.200946 type:complete len:326 (-) Transcript_92926:798-1775(-)
MPAARGVEDAGLARRVLGMWVAAPIHQLPQHLVGALLGRGHQGRLACRAPVHRVGTVHQQERGEARRGSLPECGLAALVAGACVRTRSQQGFHGGDGAGPGRVEGRRASELVHVARLRAGGQQRLRAARVSALHGVEERRLPAKVRVVRVALRPQEVQGAAEPARFDAAADGEEQRRLQQPGVHDGGVELVLHEEGAHLLRALGPRRGHEDEVLSAADGHGLGLSLGLQESDRLFDGRVAHGVVEALPQAHRGRRGRGQGHPRAGGDDRCGPPGRRRLLVAPALPLQGLQDLHDRPLLPSLGCLPCRPPGRLVVGPQRVHPVSLA